MAERYMVWDEANSSEAHADAYEDVRPEYAAESYANDDVDGNADGIYARGHVVCVRCPGGEIKRFEVTVDYSPSYSAREAANG